MTFFAKSQHSLHTFRRLQANIISNFVTTEGIFPPRINGLSNCRTPKKDLLDEVSETEDIITRKKALERGDKLMATFWDTVAENTPQPKGGPSLAVTATAVTAASVIGSAASFPKKWGFAYPASSITSTGEVGAKAATSTPLAKKKRGDEKQQIPGPGGSLSPETAQICLQLLADAKEAYEGQGFALQADGAARLDDTLLFVFVGRGE